VFGGNRVSWTARSGAVLAGTFIVLLVQLPASAVPLTDPSVTPTTTVHDWGWDNPAPQDPALKSVSCTELPLDPNLRSIDVVCTAVGAGGRLLSFYGGKTWLATDPSMTSVDPRRRDLRDGIVLQGGRRGRPSGQGLARRTGPETVPLVRPSTGASAAPPSS